MTTLDTVGEGGISRAGMVGQGTVVEQSRAVAEVAAAVQVAQACPRNVQVAVDEMRRTCQNMRNAERAFFRFPRGDKTVTGPSIHLARELARCWGNFECGVAELRRNDNAWQSEMKAWAWDVQTNTRASNTFIVPHARDVNGKRKPLEALRDIYENNANSGARRLREMILGLLPQWYVEEAKDLCMRTLEGGGGKPLPERIDGACRRFGEMGVSLEQLEARMGYPTRAWTPQDLATLSVIITSVRRGEIRLEDEFPGRVASVRTQDLPPASQPAPAPAAAPPAPAAAPAAAPPAPAPAAAPAQAAEPAQEPAQEPEPAPQSPGRVVTKAEWGRINERFREIGVSGTGQLAARARVIRWLVGEPDLVMGQLTGDQARHVLDNLVGDGGVILCREVLTDAGADPSLIPQAPDTDPSAQTPDQAEGDPDLQDPADADDPWAHLADHVDDEDAR